VVTAVLAKLAVYVSQITIVFLRLSSSAAIRSVSSDDWQFVIERIMAGFGQEKENGVCSSPGLTICHVTASSGFRIHRDHAKLALVLRSAKLAVILPVVFHP
jgi:hypothetical protein